MNLTCPVTGEYLLSHDKFSSLLLEGTDKMKYWGSWEPSCGQLLTCFGIKRHNNILLNTVMNLQKLGFSKYKKVSDKPEDNWCDSCATQVEWTHAVRLCDLSKVSHSKLQVLCSEELISNVKFSQRTTPLLSHHIDACFRCWWPKVAAEILSPEQTLKLWQITQHIQVLHTKKKKDISDF